MKTSQAFLAAAFALSGAACGTTGSGTTTDSGKSERYEIVVANAVGQVVKRIPIDDPGRANTIGVAERANGNFAIAVVYQDASTLGGRLLNTMKCRLVTVNEIHGTQIGGVIEATSVDALLPQAYRLRLSQTGAENYTGSMTRIICVNAPHQ